MKNSSSGWSIYELKTKVSGELRKQSVYESLLDPFGLQDQVAVVCMKILGLASDQASLQKIGTPDRKLTYGGSKQFPELSKA